MRARYYLYLTFSISISTSISSRRESWKFGMYFRQSLVLAPSIGQQALVPGSTRLSKMRPEQKLDPDQGAFGLFLVVICLQYPRALGLGVPCSRVIYGVMSSPESLLITRLYPLVLLRTTTPRSQRHSVIFS